MVVVCCLPVLVAVGCLALLFVGVIVCCVFAVWRCCCLLLVLHFVAVSCHRCFCCWMLSGVRFEMYVVLLLLWVVVMSRSACYSLIRVVVCGRCSLFVVCCFLCAVVVWCSLLLFGVVAVCLLLLRIVSVVACVGC